MVFRPGDPTTGLILYPGGRVDPRAYAPTARALAEEGYLVVIVPMPLNLAFFAPGRAAEVMAAFPDIESWAVGGHSLGGAMAANFAHRNPEAVQRPGLVGSVSGRQRRPIGLPIWRSARSMAHKMDWQREDEIDASRPLLPPDTQWIAIEGGNHAQFGWYGPQAGDNEATISREEQQAQIVAATLQLLLQIGRVSR